MNDVTIVVLNYRTADLTIQCLDSLVQETQEEIAVEIVVVDNDSGDKSLTDIQAWIEGNGLTGKIRVLGAEANRGFSNGNNLGIAAEKASFYLLINSDALLQSGALKELLGTFANAEDIGLVSPRLISADKTEQQSCFRFASPLSELVRAAGTSFVTRAASRHVVALENQKNLTYPEWTSFACVMIRKDVFEEIGHLDEGFFMYFEDAEFCWRAAASGWRTANNPAAKAIHLRGQSSSVKARQKSKWRMPKYYYESRTRFFFKLYGYTGLVFANLCWTAGWFIANFRSVVQKSFRNPACEGEALGIWSNVLQPLKTYTHPGNAP